MNRPGAPPARIAGRFSGTEGARGSNQDHAWAERPRLLAAGGCRRERTLPCRLWYVTSLGLSELRGPALSLARCGPHHRHDSRLDGPVQVGPCSRHFGQVTGESLARILLHACCTLCPQTGVLDPFGGCHASVILVALFGPLPTVASVRFCKRLYTKRARPVKVTLVIARKVMWWRVRGSNP